ncbi:spiro-SPASM protein [Treponema brennaborense]|uniref:Radical SAM domain protein n=1 Tax=Treponema brennaborense (strain DSM 12168 / CIP 105900 / DD5/3) TaxID=906968 RepID=F4LIN5_TREBD|nr:spiro-SPASM protein [Treponema brennaborense]AEE17260.1 Radical SAM domain protein [Treponema brennaborense DSM 12168]
MKTLISVYAGDAAGYAFEPVFGGASAFERVLSWIAAVVSAGSCGTVGAAVVFVPSGYERSVRDALASKQLPVPVAVAAGDFAETAPFIAELNRRAAGFDAVVHARGACPFYDEALTARVFALHVRSAAEYTFADGWPEGFAPCVIDTGTVAILAALAEKKSSPAANAAPVTNASPAANASPVTRDVFFELMKGDINSFEIETLVSDEDMRQYRLDFACTSKAGLTACRRLFELTSCGAGDAHRLSADELAAKAVFSSAVLRTVPSFYNVQISSVCPGTCTYCPYPSAYRAKFGHDPAEAAALNPRCFMDIRQFSELASRMADLSGEAVVALSAWGEPLAHPEFLRFIEAVLAHKGLSLLVETDGMAVTDALAGEVAAAAAKSAPRANGQAAVNWIVSLDAADESMYAAMRGAGTRTMPVRYGKALDAVSVLERYFPRSVYAQFVRTTVNEAQLETFYRGRKESGGLIIQKYDDFAGTLRNLKVADLSPLVRNPCWHQRRDMVILADGSVPMCREYLFDGICGNVFADSLENVWNRGKDMVYTDKCKACDEYYTFNF